MARVLCRIKRRHTLRNCWVLCSKSLLGDVVLVSFCWSCGVNWVYMDLVSMHMV